MCSKGVLPCTGRLAVKLTMNWGIKSRTQSPCRWREYHSENRMMSVSYTHTKGCKGCLLFHDSCADKFEQPSGASSRQPLGCTSTAGRTSTTRSWRWIEIIGDYQQNCTRYCIIVCYQCVCSISMETAIRRADEQLADWLDAEL